MNKYILLGLVAFVLIGSGIVYKAVIAPKSTTSNTQTNVKQFTIIAKKDEWKFEPAEIEVVKGDKVKLTVVNEDNYDHGIGIDAFGISQRMPANKTITVTFMVTKEGEFPYYCSVPCGEGHVDGAKRTHFDMIGKMKVKPL